MRTALIASAATFGAVVVALTWWSSPSGHVKGRACGYYGEHIHVFNRVIWGS